MKDGSVTYTIVDGFGIVEFYHEAGNSLSGQLLDSLAKSILEAGKDDSVRLILLKVVEIARFVEVQAMNWFQSVISHQEKSFYGIC